LAADGDAAGAKDCSFFVLRTLPLSFSGSLGGAEDFMIDYLSEWSEYTLIKLKH